MAASIGQPRCLLITRDYSPPAQHAYVRLPNTLMSHPIPQTLIRLIASVSERNYERIFLRASDVHKAVADETIPGGDLKAVAFLLLNQYIGMLCIMHPNAQSHAIWSRNFPSKDFHLGVEGIHINSCTPHAAISWLLD